MDNNISEEKIDFDANRINTILTSNKEYVWKNIFKIEALKKETSLKKSQSLYQNLQIKIK